jgi:hypothetical protein
MEYLITVGYDPAGIYYVYASNVPGLQVSAWRLEGLLEIVRAAVPNLVHERSAKVRIQPGLILCALPKHQHPRP